MIWAMLALSAVFFFAGHLCGLAAGIERGKKLATRPDNKSAV